MMIRFRKIAIAFTAFTGLLLIACSSPQENGNIEQKDPVDYVNPYMGNISHLLVPTFPTIHLPNSLLRVYPRTAGLYKYQIKRTTPGSYKSPWKLCI